MASAFLIRLQRLLTPAIGERKLQTRAMPVALEGEGRREKLIRPPSNIRIEEVMSREGHT